MTSIPLATAVTILRTAADESRARTSWNYDHVENVVHNAIGDALTGVADAFAKLSPDPAPYVGQSGRRYEVGETTWASLNDGPLMFEPREEYGETKDTR
jgi:hypothetical protein